MPAIELFGAELEGEARKEREAELSKDGVDTAQVNAWADMDGLLRKLAFSFSVRENGRDGRFAGTIRFFDFGKPVGVEAPPASQIDGPRLGAPCPGPAAPHTAESVVEGLEKAGYEVGASCDGNETTVIWAFPRRGDGDANDEDNDALVCRVTSSPERGRTSDGVIVDANVACGAEPSQRDAIRAVVGGLGRR